MIHILLTVKFRAGGITFGSMRREWAIELGTTELINLPERVLLNFSERGVTLVVGIS